MYFCFKKNNYVFLHPLKVKHIRDIIIGTTAGAVVGVASAVGGAFLGAGHIVAGLSSLALAGSGATMGQLAHQESEAASERSARETLLKVLEEGEDDTDEKAEPDSGASSSSSK
jgi:hypothetical protein